MLTRKSNWQTELHRFLLRHSATEFKYGSFDCCLFVCDAIEAITGTDVAAPFRGRYQSRKQAFRAMEMYAGSASVQAVTERVTKDNQMPEIAPLNAQRGDVALIQQHYYSLALIGLDGAILAAGARGYERVPSSLAVRAWRV